MSLWWARKSQLDHDQIELIEDLPLRQNCLVLGPPGSGKTNVLLRRAQFVRNQGMPNVLALTFTRSLTEFLRTGCLDAQDREIFPTNCVMTIESWIRWLYEQHEEDRPVGGGSFTEQKRRMASGALGFQSQGRLPPYDALFIDEAQDLLAEEIELLASWSSVLCFAGDSRQKLFEADGLDAVLRIVAKENVHYLHYHYRLAPEICEMADRILIPQAGTALAESGHYEGPKPGRIFRHRLGRAEQLAEAARNLRDQIRVYADLITQGDRLGVIVPFRDRRAEVLQFLENDGALHGKAKIIRARAEGERDYDPTFDPATPICILTVQGCKGLEFRAVHWLFCDENNHNYNNETYYTVVTRAKTRLDLYYSTALPQELARASADGSGDIW